MNVSEDTIQYLAVATWIEAPQPDSLISSAIGSQQSTRRDRFDLLKPLRQWLDRVEVKNPEFARFLCKLIPSQCPFERDIKLFGHKLFHIPPMCKLNPLYEEVVALRFRALCYLADECGEDVTVYC